MLATTHCEFCNKELPYQVDSSLSSGANASRAQRAGVVIKMFVLLGDDASFRYFCSNECSVAKRRQLFPDSDAEQSEIDKHIEKCKEKIRNEFSR